MATTQQKKCYSYNPVTFQYVGEAIATACPIEGDKVYHYPAHTTDLAPPEPKDGAVVVFDKSKNAWSYKPIKVEPPKPKTPPNYRLLRNSLLAKTDMYMLVDIFNKLSTEEQSAWQSYRQYLRDLPTKEEFNSPDKWQSEPKKS